MEMNRESTRSPCLENSFSKGLWTGRKVIYLIIIIISSSSSSI
jgi:hypothetical protein